MVTLRAFASQIEAALAKSVLEEHNIRCVLADEGAHLMSGAQFAVPVRLLVPAEQAEQAARILEDGGKELPDAEVDAVLTSEPFGSRRDNPWELLAIALLVAIPGVILLFQGSELVSLAPRGMTLMHQAIYRGIRRSDILVMSPGTAHVIGLLALAIAMSLVVLYFYLLRSASRQEQESEGG